MASHSVLDTLPDDALLAIGGWVVATGPENLARCLKVNRRLRTVFGQPQFLADAVRQCRNRGNNQNLKTLQDLALWQAVENIGLVDENRIGFDYASLDIANDRPRRMHPDDITFSQERVLKVARTLSRFPDSYAEIPRHHSGSGLRLRPLEPWSPT